MDLRRSTASQELPLGPFVDSTDGNTPETGLTIANTDMNLWKTGATSFVTKNSGGATHIANGVYYTVLDATDTNTIGPMTLYVHPTGALPMWVECRVLHEALYDQLYGSTACSTLDAASLRTAVGLSSANLDTQLTAIVTDTAEIGVAGAGLTALASQTSVNTIDDLLDTEIAAIKAKTDQLAFTVANQVDVNVQYVNDTQVTGNGQPGTEWGSAP